MLWDKASYLCLKAVMSSVNSDIMYIIKSTVVGNNVHHFLCKLKATPCYKKKCLFPYVSLFIRYEIVFHDALQTLVLV
jgi:hypothetical protein